MRWIALVLGMVLVLGASVALVSAQDPNPQSINNPYFVEQVINGTAYDPVLSYLDANGQPKQVLVFDSGVSFGPPVSPEEAKRLRPELPGEIGDGSNKHEVREAGTIKLSRAPVLLKESWVGMVWPLYVYNLTMPGGMETGKLLIEVVVNRVARENGIYVTVLKNGEPITDPSLFKWENKDMYKGQQEAKVLTAIVPVDNQNKYQLGIGDDLKATPRGADFSAEVSLLE